MNSKNHKNYEGIDYLNSLEMWKGSGNFTPETTEQLLAEFDNPQNKYKTIHVGGTNGKGSCATFISSILSTSGKKVGLTTSPHLNDPEERIVIDGYQISREILNKCLIKLSNISKKINLVPTYHEALTVCAFLIFAEQNVDYAVIEVGLGGRLDSTNVIKHPELICITSLHYDHQKILGSTLTEIATEKAGIFKKGVPVILGKMMEEGLGVFLNNADELECKCSAYMRDFVVIKTENVFEYKDNDISIVMNPVLNAEYQRGNIGVAVRAAIALGLSEADIKMGIENAFIPGRLESIVHWGKKFILDGAHNAEGVDALVDQISSTIFETIIFGSLNTKDWKFALDNAIRVGREIFLVESASEMSVDAKELENYVSCFGIRYKNFGRDIQGALIEAKSETLVFGSLYLIGEVRKILSLEEKARWKT